MTPAMWIGLIAAIVLGILMLAVSMGHILRRASEDLDRVVHETRETGRTEPLRRK